MKNILNYFGAVLFVALLGINVYSSLENPMLFASEEALAQGSSSNNSAGEACEARTASSGWSWVWNAVDADCEYVYGGDSGGSDDDDETECPSPYDAKDFTLKTVERNNCFYKECARPNPGQCCDVVAQIFIMCND